MLRLVTSIATSTIEKQDSNIKINRLFVKCKEASISAIEKNEELSDLAHEIEIRTPPVEI